MFHSSLGRIRRNGGNGKTSGFKSTVNFTLGSGNVNKTRGNRGSAGHGEGAGGAILIFDKERLVVYDIGLTAIDAGTVGI